MDMQAFYTGHAFDAYEFFGAHTYFGGTHFAVWAPAAQYVQVVGEFGEYGMHRTYAGVWEADVNGADAGMAYQYRVTGANGRCVDHCDPYGFAMKLRPDGRSIIAERPTGFADEAWLAARSKNYDKPLNIYEVHMGSWQQKEDGSWYTYAELAELLPAYCKKYGYTHLELMPLAEYPFDGSWGYQTTGFFAPTSRYGTPDELAQFINACHKQGIGVILDFVPVHFAVDEYGLKEFDGTPLYEYPAASVGQSEWGSCNFMHSRGEIRCFIQSCADYWLRVFHADGLRMDAVSRLIYWQGDPNRGVNGSTLEFLKGMNAGLQQRHPTAMLIAEDSTNFPKVTAPVEYGGLGFDYKWDLGWMNDTLDYFKKTPEERKHNLSKLTFSMMYAWNEHYILPFSHDENVHGKATIVQKMYGEYEGKFPQARALYLYMAIHPGKKLDFMGNEFAQLREWDESREQDWSVLKYPNHDSFRVFRKALNEAYLQNDGFWLREYDPAAFRWLDCAHPEKNACAIWRQGSEGGVLAAFNFGDSELTDYELTLPQKGKLTLLLDTDWTDFGGSTTKPAKGKALPAADKLTLNLPPFSGVLYALTLI
ncbi:1,4-alpha-glucan branching protein GlgB [uncultured Gemmiger sp.]|uniref:1,4-alpha-glucan branching protein GlgB n=1 Tax=uncultured Gemmiger sp. TaxID=1623490 RepID=UPI0027DBE0FF|nr:1,4-alpha-glucan branching protein GlgB [uncultured Gemmiger sp.]